MPEKTRTVRPSGAHPRVVRDLDGTLLRVPDDWALLAAGDAGLTRRLKGGGPSWTVKEKKGRREFSRGVWAPERRVNAVKLSIANERETPQYKRRLEQGRKRAAREQLHYIEQFTREVEQFLAFPSLHNALATQMAEAIATHATPVGSGTVARTKRIPIEERAEAAVIAWMRHQTTAYDHMVIPREKGLRREVRRRLARRSRQLLDRYRQGQPLSDTCPLSQAFVSANTAETEQEPTVE